MQALIAAGEPVTATEVVSGLAYLKQAQQPDGGFAYDLTSGGGSDANSTAYAIQALVAAGEDPAGEAWRVGGVLPVAYLLSLQLPDGSFEWQKDLGSNLFATQQAIPALLQRVSHCDQFCGAVRVEVKSAQPWRFALRMIGLLMIGLVLLVASPARAQEGAAGEGLSPAAAMQILTARRWRPMRRSRAAN